MDASLALHGAETPPTRRRPRTFASSLPQPKVSLSLLLTVTPVRNRSGPMIFSHLGQALLSLVDIDLYSKEERIEVVHLGAQMNEVNL